MTKYEYEKKTHTKQTYYYWQLIDKQKNTFLSPKINWI